MHIQEIEVLVNLCSGTFPCHQNFPTMPSKAFYFSGLIIFLSLSLSSEYLLCQNIRNANLLLCFQFLLLPFSLSFYSIHYRLVVFAERSFVRG